MIMVIVILYLVNMTPFKPEVNRGKTYYFADVLSTGKEDGRRISLNYAGYPFIRDCYFPLECAEVVTGIIRDDWNTYSLQSMDGLNSYNGQLVKTDPAFWRLYAFDFVAGAPFSEANFRSGIREAVVSDRVARTLFGTEQAVGRELKLEFVTFRVCGVVKEVSRFATQAFADIWIPYTTNESCQSSFNENMVGSFRVLLLAKAQGDFDVIRQELKQQITRYNATKEKYEISFFENPITQWDKAMGTDGQNFVDWKDFWLETGGAMLFLLLVPVLNLLGVTQSSIRKRQAEIGVRKAFGATSGNIVRQVLYENGLMSLLGGMIGLLLSWSLFPLCKDFLLKASDTTLRAEMLFRPEAFVLALLFCLLINLLSAGLPAWWISRKPIYEALKNGEETNK